MHDFPGFTPVHLFALTCQIVEWDGAWGYGPQYSATKQRSSGTATSTSSSSDKHKRRRTIELQGGGDGGSPWSLVDGMPATVQSMDEAESTGNPAAASPASSTTKGRKDGNPSELGPHKVKVGTAQGRGGGEGDGVSADSPDPEHQLYALVLAKPKKRKKGRQKLIKMLVKTITRAGGAWCVRWFCPELNCHSRAVSCWSPVAAAIVWAVA
jgi:hypothetical protein